MFAFAGLSPSHVVVLLLLGVLLFGNRLPDVGKNLARAIRDFKDGMNGIEKEVGHVSLAPDASLSAPRPPQRLTAPQPKFDAADIKGV